MEKITLLPNDNFYQLSTTELLGILKNGLLLERGRALFMLALRTGDNKELMHTVLKEIYDSKNRNAITIGTVSISFLGIAGLLEAEPNDTQEIVKKFIESCTASERSVLLIFLNSIYQSTLLAQLSN